MGVFYVFQIVQMVPNLAKHHILYEIEWYSLFVTLSLKNYIARAIGLIAF